MPPPARYARQIALPGFGLAGQQRLSAASVLIVGAGGLGSPAALYLAAAGVGRLGLADDDVVDRSNLHRQLLYGDADVGRPKLDAARDRLRDVNPDVAVDTHAVRVDATNADAVIDGYDVVVDATDNFPARYAVGDACARRGTALVHGSVSRFEGRVTLLVAGGAPCYRCLFPAAPPPNTVPSCAEAGVLGVLPGMIGTMQATEVIKHVAGIGETLAGRLLLVDALRMHVHTVAVARDPACSACGAGARRSGSGKRGGVRHPLPDPRSPIPEITAREAAVRLRAAPPPTLLDVREPWEYDTAHVDGARLVPLQTLPSSLAPLDPAGEYLVLCHHGVRSAMAAEYLRERGFARVTNVAGGIDAWSRDVDSSVPRY